MIPFYSVNTRYYSSSPWFTFIPGRSSWDGFSKWCYQGTFSNFLAFHFRKILLHQKVRQAQRSYRNGPSVDLWFSSDGIFIAPKVSPRCGFGLNSGIYGPESGICRPSRRPHNPILIPKCGNCLAGVVFLPFVYWSSRKFSETIEKLFSKLFSILIISIGSDKIEVPRQHKLGLYKPPTGQ